MEVEVAVTNPSRTFSAFYWENGLIRLVEHDGPGDDAYIRLEITQTEPACEVSLEIEDGAVAEHLRALIDRTLERRETFFGCLEGPGPGKGRKRKPSFGDKDFPPVIFQRHGTDIIVRSADTPVLAVVKDAVFIRGLETALEAYRTLPDFGLHVRFASSE